jgi:hypothetical protein
MHGLTKRRGGITFHIFDKYLQNEAEIQLDFGKLQNLGRYTI